MIVEAGLGMAIDYASNDVGEVGVRFDAQDQAVPGYLRYS
jgi:hypothetical protein